eukprot:6383261-Pyramimonas_sp.AAC.1
MHVDITMDESSSDAHRRIARRVARGDITAHSGPYFRALSLGFVVQKLGFRDNVKGLGTKNVPPLEACAVYRLANEACTVC